MKPNSHNSEKAAGGGTLFGTKKDVYIILKIFKLIYGISITSFSLKYAVHQALKGRKYETAALETSLERALRFHTIKGKFVGVHHDLEKIGVKKILLVGEHIGFIFDENDF